jgi:hypothetical protein
MDPHNVSKLKSMVWNADSVSPKKNEFFEYLIDNKIYVALINETYLKQGVPFSHPNYKCYRLDRHDRPKGGVAILVRHDITHSLLPSFNMKLL